MGKPKPSDAVRSNRIIGVVLSAMLVVAMAPVIGAQCAFADADESAAERPATSGGDVALESVTGAGASAAPVAEEREDGMLAAGGLLYTIADGGLALVGFDGASTPEGALAVPAAVSVDGRDVAVVAVALAEGAVAEGVVALSIPQCVKDVQIEGLAAAFPNLAALEVSGTAGSSLPVAAGAAAMRATYSSFGGALLGQATVEVKREDGAAEAVQGRELLWAPPAMVVARIPVDCLSIAAGAFADVRALETVVCFGDVQQVATAERDEDGGVTVPGALTDDQLASVTVVFPDATPAVPSEGDGRVSASMALNDTATQTDKRRAWIDLGFPLDRLSMGKPVGSLTETVAVNDDGAVSTADLRLISYPGMHPQATDVKHPGEDGTIDMAASGLAFKMKSDMTLSVHWEGDITATPAHLEIPAYVTIDNVKYPVTEVAPSAFEGAAFLASVAIPEGVSAIGASAFAGCANLSEASLPTSLKMTCQDAFEGIEASGNDAPGIVMEKEAFAGSFSRDASEDESAHIATSESAAITAPEGGMLATEGYVTPYADFSSFSIRIPTTDGVEGSFAGTSNMTFTKQSDGETWVGVSHQSSVTAVFIPDDDLSAVSQTYSLRIRGCFKGGSPFFDLGTLTFKTGVNRVLSGVTITGANVGTSLGSGADSTSVLTITPTVTSAPSSGCDCDLSAYVTTTALNAKGYITKAVNNLDNYYTKTTTDNTFAKKTDIPSLTGYATQTWVEGKGYLTSASLNGYLKTTDADKKYAAVSHTHDDRYYTESEMNTKLAGKADASHTHDDRYYTESEINTKLSAYVTTTALDAKGYITKSASNLDNYYTKTASDGRYQPKGDYAAANHNHDSAYAVKSHTHDDRYYTESEMNTKLAGKADANHTHADYLTSASLNGYLKTADADKKYSALGHNHDDRYYTEGEVDTKLNAYVTTTALGTTLANYVTNKTASDTYATKQTVNALATTVAGKADKTYVDGELAKKLNANAISKYDTNQKIDDALAGKATNESLAAVQKALDDYKKEAEAAYATKSELAAAKKDLADNYYTKADVDGKLGKIGESSVKELLDTKLDRADVDKYDTNQKIDDALAAVGKDAADALDAAKGEIEDMIGELDGSAVKASEFGTIRYEGLDALDAGVYPTSYRAGGVPSLHAPVREGYAFAGWSWARSGDAAASGDDGDLAEAFAQAGAVTLTATWHEVVPEANHFFSDGVPLRANDNAEYQSHVIKVRLSDLPGDALSQVEFVRNDTTGLLKEGSPVELWIGSGEDVLSSGTRLELGENASTPRGWRCALAQLGDESWGVYVGVRVKTADVQGDRIMSSYTDGSYVVSLVKMNYTFA